MAEGEGWHGDHVLSFEGNVVQVPPYTEGEDGGGPPLSIGTWFSQADGAPGDTFSTLLYFDSVEGTLYAWDGSAYVIISYQ